MEGALIGKKAGEWGKSLGVVQGGLGGTEREKSQRGGDGRKNQDRLDGRVCRGEV